MGLKRKRSDQQSRMLKKRKSSVVVQKKKRAYKNTGGRARKVSKPVMVEEVKAIVRDVVMKNTAPPCLGTYVKGYTGELIAVGNPDVKQICLGASRLGSSVAPYNILSMGFTPHTRKRILDAVSVLYNAKAAGVQIDAAGNFATKGLKVKIVYAGYEMRMYNYSNFDYEYKLIEFTNKESGDNSAVSTASELNADMPWAAAGSTPTYLLSATNQWTVEHMHEFGAVEGLRRKYAMKIVKRGVLKPGKFIKYYSCIKNQMIDFDEEKLTQTSGSATLPNHCKGDKQLLFEYTPVTHIGYNSGTGAEGTATHFADRDVKYNFPIIVKEVYKLEEPEQTAVANRGEKRAHYFDSPGAAAFTDALFMNTGPDYTVTTVAVT